MVENVTVTRHDHWIDGKATTPASGTYLSTTDPATREPGDEVAAGTAGDVDRAVEAAWRAQPGRRALKPCTTTPRPRPVSLSLH